MAAEAARVYEDYHESYFGTAAPVRETYDEPAERPIEIPGSEERLRQRQRARSAATERRSPGVSLLAILGTGFATVLMVFVVLAQISYNEIAGETVRLNAQFRQLTEEQRRLEITFESVINMKEVERYARDVLGMSRPESDQIAVVQSNPADRAEIIDASEESVLRGFGSFISSLMEYFKR